MDCSWLLEDEAEAGSESGSDTETQELESRLYSIIHHNDLSQPLDPQLAKHYSVHSDDNGQVVVTLNDSLDVLKSEESKTDQLEIDKLSEGVIEPNVIETNDDNVVVISDVPPWRSHKRMRYSDINIDDELERSNAMLDSLNNTPVEIKSKHNLNFFNLGQSFFQNKKHRRFKDIIIPQYKESDWKIDANSSFISIDHDAFKTKRGIIEKIKNTLKKVNPTVSTHRLSHFAEVLYRGKMKSEKRAKRSKAKKDLSGISTTLELAEEISVNEELMRLKVHLSNYKKVKQREAVRMNGSISLNISPFIPTPVIDLSSDQEQTSPSGEKDSLSTSNREVPKQLPDKWTKAMIKYYTKPSRKKMEMDIDTIIENMGKTTLAEDWYLDPRDRNGYYQRKGSKGSGVRCANCRERGHLVRQCPKPLKTPTCSLCGQYYHTYYSCPNNVCLKCGVYISFNKEECDSCYYLAFEDDVPCETCGKLTHRSINCPDFWRSFHSTIEGEKKIPDKVVENKKKCCCNCASTEHFSHNCSQVTYGQQTSCFVTNYSAIPSETGSAEVFLPIQYAHIVNNHNTDNFMQNLSNTTSAEITIDQQDLGFVFRVSGTFEQCTRVKSEIQTFVNTSTRKRKRNEMLPRRKKQKTKAYFF